MNRSRLAGLLPGILLALALGRAFAGEIPEFTYERVLQAIIDSHPTLEIAALQVERARQELVRVESGLGWRLRAQAGLNRDVSFLGTPSDVATLSGGLERQFASGHSIGVEGWYRFEDSALLYSPFLPNPSHATGIDLKYRIPLGRGRSNPAYVEGLASAEAEVLLERANRLAVREQLARQTLTLFYGLATLRASLETAASGVQRARRLRRYIENRFALGLAEERDRLQAEAQLQSQIAEWRRLQVLWSQQRTSLNRLMGRPWKAELRPRVSTTRAMSIGEDRIPALQSEAEANSPELLRARAQQRQAEAQLALRRDQRRDQLDMVMSIGTRTLSGDSTYGSVSELDVAGGVTLEYQNSLDKRGFDAVIYQTRLAIRMAEEEARKVRDDLRYRVAGLVDELTASARALRAYRARVDSETAKVAEARRLHREGRMTTDRLIQFENDLQAARFARDQQAIEHARLRQELAVLRGEVWRQIGLDDGEAAP